MDISDLPAESSALTRTAAHSPAALRLSLLFDALVWVAQCSDIDTLLEGLPTKLSWVLEFERCIVARTQGETVDLYQLHPPNKLHDESVTGPATEQEKSMIRNAITDGKPERAMDSTNGVRAILCLPLRTGESTIGAILFGFPNKIGFGAENVAFAEATGTYLALAIDRLTQMRRLQVANQALERSNLELQQFAYIASHDLQTPLRSISGFIQLLQKRYDGQLDEQADEWIDRAVQATANLQSLINDLLVYSRVESRARPFETVDLNEAFADAQAMLQSSLDDTGGKINLSALPKVTGDRAQMVQLFQNLIGNAIKYHREDEPPEINVTAEGTGEEWIIRIEDNGIGIRAEHQERVFEIFRRLHGPTEYPGTGIGLAICRRLVHRHDGRVWIEMSEPGVGSVFCLALPDRGIPQD